MTANEPSSVINTSSSANATTTDAMDIATDTTASRPPKRKAVDDAFERLFGYKWGTQFDLDQHKVNSSSVLHLVEIFGAAKTARILGSVSSSNTNKRQKVVKPAMNPILDYKSIELPKQLETRVTETKVFAGQVIQTTTKKQQDDKQPPPKPAASAGLDNVLAQLEGPKKMSTVQKTSNDWEQFKESDKQLQDDLEKKAQGKDAFLVKQDFLNRVDERKFELEREKRDRERAKRAVS